MKPTLKPEATMSNIAAQSALPLLSRSANNWRDHAERALVHAEPVSRIALYASLAIIYAWFGGMKFTDYEAQGLVPLVENSPLLSWFYALFSVRAFSTFLGIVELSIGLLIVLRLANPIFSAAGGLLSAGLFVTTLSFMISTPGVVVPELGAPAISVAPGQFLLKDVGLFAASFWVFVDSLKTVIRR
jgi:reactive chlorine resistance protein C